jgi:hypothetical protein
MVDDWVLGIMRMMIRQELEEEQVMCVCFEVLGMTQQD